VAAPGTMTPHNELFMSNLVITRNTGTKMTEIGINKVLTIMTKVRLRPLNSYLLRAKAAMLFMTSVNSVATMVTITLFFKNERKLKLVKDSV